MSRRALWWSGYGFAWMPLVFLYGIDTIWNSDGWAGLLWGAIAGVASIVLLVQAWAGFTDIYQGGK